MGGLKKSPIFFVCVGKNIIFVENKTTKNQFSKI